jgi:DivIVA domain-containing protein
MGTFFLLLIAAVVVGAIVFGVAVLITGDDPGIEGNEPDGRSIPLPGTRPLTEGDVGGLRFDIAIRGYRMGQVDAALRRAAYDLGYKEELIGVLEAEIAALREGRTEEADQLRATRDTAESGGEKAPADLDIDLDLDEDEVEDAQIEDDKLDAEPSVSK